MKQSNTRQTYNSCFLFPLSLARKSSTGLAQWIGWLPPRLELYTMHVAAPESGCAMVPAVDSILPLRIEVYVCIYVYMHAVRRPRIPGRR